MAGLVLDAGPLIKLEGRYPIALALVKEAKQRGEELLVAGATYTEVWRGHRNGVGTPMSIALKNVKPVRTTEMIGKLAGELLQKASLDETHGFDAIVVATAASRGAEVVTGDPADIGRLAAVAGVGYFEL
jgi:predicted nucleic acid-binding protein